MRRAGLAVDVHARLRAGRSVVLEGPAGIGKSHLLRMVLDGSDASGGAVLRAAASPVAARIGLGALAPLVPVAAAARPTAAERIADVSAWFAASGPLLLAVDDLEHVDDESLVVLHHLLLNGTATLLAAARVSDAQTEPAALAQWRRDALVDVVELPSLDEDEARAMIEARLGGTVAAATAHVLHAASGGNPMLLDELVRHNQACGNLERRSGAWVGSELEPSSTLVELLRMRTQALGPSARRAVQLVAFAGPLAESLLVGLAGAAGVREAIATDLLVVGRPGELAVSHPMVAETIVASTPLDDQVGLLADAAHAVLSAPDAGGTWAVPMASWMLAVADRSDVHVDRVLDVAVRLVANLRPDLAERLARATGDAGGDRAEALVARARAMQGLPADPDAPDAASSRAAFEAALGGIEAFMLGFVDSATCREAIERAGPLLQGDDADELAAAALGYALFSGGHAATTIDRLVALARRHDGGRVACIAGATAIAGLAEVGRFYDALEIAELMLRSGALDNAFHSMQQALSTAESLHRLGRRADALALVDARLTLAPGAGAPMAAVYAGAVLAQVALADGRPDLAAGHFGTVIAAIGGIDPAGIGSWATRGLRLAEVWLGDRAAAEDRPPPLPPQGAFQVHACRLLEVEALQASGARRASHAAAVELGHRAAADGHWYEALLAVHLACTVVPTTALADWAAELAAHCDGELVGVLADHASALARADGPGLEKAGHALAGLGQAALGLDALQRAADELRRVGSAAAAARAAAAADELLAAGTVPRSPALRLTLAHALTPREAEVAELAAAGASNREIAARIGLSARTVETHLQRCYSKLGVHDRDGLRALGFEASGTTTPAT